MDGKDNYTTPLVQSFPPPSPTHPYDTARRGFISTDSPCPVSEHRLKLLALVDRRHTDVRRGLQRGLRGPGHELPRSLCVY
jgi:hypothetical protein